VVQSGGKKQAWKTNFQNKNAMTKFLSSSDCFLPPKLTIMGKKRYYEVDKSYGYCQG
jgi:hypothetical protein